MAPSQKQKILEQLLQKLSEYQRRWRKKGLNDADTRLKINFDGIERTAKATSTEHDVTLEFEGRDVEGHILIFSKEDLETATEQEIKERIYVAYYMHRWSPDPNATRELLMNTLRKNKPSLYKGSKTSGEIIKGVEDYLFTEDVE